MGTTPRDAMNPPAFPVHPGLPRDDARNGMSLRDYFAAQALAGIMAAGDEGNWDNFATDAYRIADAMLRMRGGEGAP